MRVGRKSPVRVEAAAPAGEVVQAAVAAVLEEPAAVQAPVGDAGEPAPAQAKSVAKSKKRKK